MDDGDPEVRKTEGGRESEDKSHRCAKSQLPRGKANELSSSERMLGRKDYNDCKRLFLLFSFDILII